MKKEYSIQVLFEDNHLIVVNKHPGEIVQGDKTGDETIGDRIKLYIKEKYDKPGDVFLGTVHRIDRPVSGIVVFARTSKGLERMNKLFREKDLQKTYWAVVKNTPPKEADHLISYLWKNEKQNKSYATSVPKAGALLSELDYKILIKSDNYTLLEVKPITGRHHQIRVQLSGIGCPIKGDLKYGFNRSNENGSIHLHARAITFEHPVTKAEINIVAEPPSDPLWDYFKKITN